MSDFLRKTKELNKVTTLAPSIVPESDPFVYAPNLAGERLLIPSYQLPETSPYENSNIYRYTASGNYTNNLNTGGGVQIYLTRGSGSGPLNGVLCLRMQVYNPNASACYFIPAPLWIQNIQYFTPSGSPVAVQDGQGLYNNIEENADSDEYYMLQKALVANNAYCDGDPILPSQTANIYIPLQGNPLSPGKFLMAAMAGDFQILVNFFSSSVFQTSGGNCNLVAMTIEAPMAQLSEGALSSAVTQYKMMKHSWFYPYERVQTVTQNWNASSQYQIQLTGIAGDVTFIRFAMYPSLSGQDLANPVPISTFQFLNNGGEPISGMNVIEELYNRAIQQPKWVSGRSSRRTKKYIYCWAKNNDGVKSLIQKGQKYGSYPFTNKESIIITTAQAGTNEVVTLTPSSAPTSGTFQLLWTNPDMGDCITAPIAYNATAATIQSAINNLLNFTGSCTVTGTMATSVVVTFTGGGYQNRSMNSDGFCLEVVGNSLIGTTYTIGVSSTVTTAGVSGITSGNSYILKIWAYTTSLGHQLTDGTVESQNSG
jgi:hypothetical protein